MAPKRVLIVDDAVFMRNMIRDIFSSDGFEVVGEAAHGIEAIEKHKELKPDLTTMDIVMPYKSGIEATREIVKADPKAVVVICSALGQESLVMEAIEGRGRGLHRQAVPRRGRAGGGEEGAGREAQGLILPATLDMSRYLGLFVAEASEHLEALGKDLVALEGAPATETVDSLFRHAHSVKGMAASMGLEPIAQLAHRMEDLIDAARRVPGILGRERVDLLLAATDAMLAMVRGTGEGRAPTPEPELLARLGEAVTSLTGAAPSPTRVAAVNPLARPASLGAPRLEVRFRVLPSAQSPGPRRSVPSSRALLKHLLGPSGAGGSPRRCHPGQVALVPLGGAGGCGGARRPAWCRRWAGLSGQPAGERVSAVVVHASRAARVGAPEHSTTSWRPASCPSPHTADIDPFRGRAALGRGWSSTPWSGPAQQVMAARMTERRWSRPAPRGPATSPPAGARRRVIIARGGIDGPARPAAS
jgi:CheY-like chemotaxis protein